MQKHKLYQMLAQESLLLYTNVVYNTAQNSSNNLCSYRPDDQHSSDVVCLGLRLMSCFPKTSDPPHCYLFLDAC